MSSEPQNLFLCNCQSPSSLVTEKLPLLCIATTSACCLVRSLLFVLTLENLQFLRDIYYSSQNFQCFFFFLKKSIFSYWQHTLRCQKLMCLLGFYIYNHIFCVRRQFYFLLSRICIFLSWFNLLGLSALNLVVILSFRMMMTIDFSQIFKIRCKSSLLIPIS